MRNPASYARKAPALVADQGSLFEEHRCAKCGWKYGAHVVKCLGCGSWGSVVAAGAAPEQIQEWDPLPLSRITMDKVQRVDLQDPALNALFGGGPVRSCSYLFSAPPGFGKSTWALQSTGFFERPLYVTGEESRGAVKLRAHRVKANESAVRVIETKNLEIVARHITDEYDALILDSVHRMRTDDSGGAIGSASMTETVISLASDIVRKLGLVGFFVGHLNKDGEASGKLSNQHDVDGTIEGEICLSPSKRRTKRRRFTISKHRHGDDGIVVECLMTAHGLDDFALIASDEAESE